jgi:DMSO/TMAO reductase YedYZ molybdopterin-dependent catalytic subunit
MDKPFGSELDGRQFTALSNLDDKNLVTPAERFYLRTRASQLLPQADSWTVAVDGLVESPRRWKISELQELAKPVGLHLLECAGNARAAHFGMMSVGDWAGIYISEILGRAKVKSSASQVMVSGFDRYEANSVTSIPGASWIFKLDDLFKAGAFLATQLDGATLSRDHGAPVRLVAPNWYGCACIKWVDQISLLGNEAEATSQMLEYATRTNQNGSPRLAKDFVPARIEHAAMPVLVEKWLVGEKLRYRVVGLLWGGNQSITRLGIRFNPEEEFVTVDSLSAPQKTPWSLWSHYWAPARRGTYTIRMAIQEPQLHPKRLDAGYYERSVEIAEI